MEQEHVSARSSGGQDSAPQPQQEQARVPEEHAAGHGSEGHAGQGSESAMKQLREWEQRRSVVSGGKRRNGPG